MISAICLQQPLLIRKTYYIWKTLISNVVGCLITLISSNSLSLFWTWNWRELISLLVCDICSNFSSKVFFSLLTLFDMSSLKKKENIIHITVLVNLISLPLEKFWNNLRTSHFFIVFSPYMIIKIRKKQNFIILTGMYLLWYVHFVFARIWTLLILS